jgi:hypothetical protein
MSVESRSSAQRYPRHGPRRDQRAHRDEDQWPEDALCFRPPRHRAGGPYPRCSGTDRDGHNPGRNRSGYGRIRSLSSRSFDARRCSSAAEQGSHKPRVGGSIPPTATILPLHQVAEPARWGRLAAHGGCPSPRSRGRGDRPRDTAPIRRGGADGATPLRAGGRAGLSATGAAGTVEQTASLPPLFGRRATLRLLSHAIPGKENRAWPSRRPRCLPSPASRPASSGSSRPMILSGSLVRRGPKGVRASEVLGLTARAPPPAARRSRWCSSHYMGT